MSIRSTLAALASVATVTLEFRVGADAQTRTPLDALVRSCPALARYPTYLEFLRSTGGAHIHNREFSLGIYGFGGEIVTSFAEGQFLDDNRYFQFGEVLYHRQPDPVFVFAFDLKALSDQVVTSAIERSDYRPCAHSFVALLQAFIRGEMPRCRR
jgi:hypothetical protein